MSEQGERGKPSTIAEVLETDEAKGLLETGREAGSLSTEEIALALGELELDAAQVDDFYHALEELHIEVVESREAVEREVVPQPREVTTDSLQLFLKDIGKVDLLTAAQEVELAKRIERGEHRAKQEMVEANLRIVEKLNKIVRSERKLRAELGREPSSYEIGIDVELGTDEVEQIRRSSQAPVSLEKPVGDEEESEFGHFLTDETEPLPDEVAEVELRKATLQRVLGTLSARERRVLELRYGLNGEHPRTLDEVGRTFNVTRERIRQIENQSLKKLRALADSVALRDVA